MKSTKIAALLFAAGCTAALAAGGAPPTSQPAPTSAATLSADDIKAIVAANALSITTPAPKDFVRYERVQPLFKNKVIPKEHGDAIIAALHGGAALKSTVTEETLKLVADGACIDPAPISIRIVAIKADGSRYALGFANPAAIEVPLPSGGTDTVTLTPAARDEMSAALTTLQDDYVAEVTAAFAAKPRPFTYTLSSGPDGGTLSGVSRLMYDTPNRWKDIYAANRSKIADPNTISPGLKLLIPP
ncbi:MAG TPA: hypothetical protein VH253_16390 [Phycisphaerae bacterium]|nr:hypothetical protein [Phycisphaerae bacterium]